MRIRTVKHNIPSDRRTVKEIVSATLIRIVKHFKPNLAINNVTILDSAYNILGEDRGTWSALHKEVCGVDIIPKIIMGHIG